MCAIAFDILVCPSLQGRARARDAEYVILVDEELMEDFSDEIRVFKGIESVSVAIDQACSRLLNG